MRIRLKLRIPILQQTPVWNLLLSPSSWCNMLFFILANHTWRFVNTTSIPVCFVNQCPSTSHTFSGFPRQKSYMRTRAGINLTISIIEMLRPMHTRGPAPNYIQVSQGTTKPPTPPRHRFTAMLHRFISLTLSSLSNHLSSRNSSASSP